MRDRLLAASLIVSFSSLALSGWLLVREGEMHGGVAKYGLGQTVVVANTAPVVPVPASTNPFGPGSTAAASTNAAKPASAGTEGKAVAAVAAPPSATPVAAAPAPKRYVNFEVPSRSLQVQQTQNGAISVINSDPSIAGERMLIKAMAADGSVEEMTVIAPPVVSR